MEFPSFAFRVACVGPPHDPALPPSILLVCGVQVIRGVADGTTTWTADEGPDDHFGGTDAQRHGKDEQEGGSRLRAVKIPIPPTRAQLEPFG